MDIKIKDDPRSHDREPSGPQDLNQRKILQRQSLTVVKLYGSKCADEPSELYYLGAYITETANQVIRQARFMQTLEITTYTVTLELTHSCLPFQHLLSERLTSLGIMGEPRVPPLCR